MDRPRSKGVRSIKYEAEKPDNESATSKIPHIISVNFTLIIYKPSDMPK